jgi:hypothetical protein
VVWDFERVEAGAERERERAHGAGDGPVGFAGAGVEVEVLRGDRRRGRVHAGTHQVACNRVCVSRGRIVYKPRRGELVGGGGDCGSRMIRRRCARVYVAWRRTWRGGSKALRENISPDSARERSLDRVRPLSDQNRDCNRYATTTWSRFRLAARWRRSARCVTDLNL